MTAQEKVKLLALDLTKTSKSSAFSPDSLDSSLGISGRGLWPTDKVTSDQAQGRGNSLLLPKSFVTMSFF